MSKDRPALRPQQTELSRDLSEFDITMIGVGAMIGAGIFVLIGIAAGEAGPAVLLALVLNGIVTLFTAMVYAELGSAIPEAGGGYLWVKEALGRQQSFLAGWMSWFSHSVAGALYALGFGSFVADLVRRAGMALPELGPLSANKWLGVLVVLIFLAINFRGASETGLAGNIITIAKVSVIALFVAFGIAAIAGEPSAALNRFEPMFPSGFTGVLTAMGLTFIAFEGYEIIVQAGEEVRNPSKTIPRAVFKSLMVVIPIYALVAFTMIGAVDPPGGSTIGEFLGRAGELGLAEAADAFMPAGAIVILVGGILSTVSALNATTYSSTRVAFAMGRDRVMPDAFARVHDRFRTPYLSLAATGVLILGMVVFIPIESVAAAADVMFLLLFLQVHYAVIRIRGEMGDRIDYGYRMPWYPLVPILGIVLNTGLAIFLVFFELLGWFFAIGWIAAGFGVFFIYSRGRVEHEDRPAVAFEEKKGRRTEDTVLASLGTTDNAEAVLRVGGAIARDRDVELIALNVVRVPPQLTMSDGRNHAWTADPVIDKVREIIPSLHGVQVSTLVGVGRRISRTIESMAEREEAKTIVLGWKGTVHAERVRGSVAQEFLRSTAFRTLVVKDNGAVAAVEQIVVAVSPGLGQSDTVSTGCSLSRGLGVPLKLVTAVREEDLDEPALRDWIRELESQTREEGVSDVTSELLTGPTAAETLSAAAHEKTLLVIGSSRDWFLRRNLFGAFADAIANQARASVVMVHHPESMPERVWHQIAGYLRLGGPKRERFARIPQ